MGHLLAECLGGTATRAAGSAPPVQDRAALQGQTVSMGKAMPSFRQQPSPATLEVIWSLGITLF